MAPVRPSAETSMLPDSSCEIATLGAPALNLIEASTPWSLSRLTACASTTLLMLGVLCTIIVKRLPLMPFAAVLPLPDESSLDDPQPATTIAAAASSTQQPRVALFMTLSPCSPLGGDPVALGPREQPAPQQLQPGRGDHAHQRGRDDRGQQVRGLEGVPVVDDQAPQPGHADLHLGDDHADQRLAEPDPQAREDARDRVRERDAEDRLAPR